MLWLNYYFLQAPPPQLTTSDLPVLVQYILVLAPILSFLAAFSNLLLARYIFTFTKKKNDTDRNIKWFQELVYTPNKEALSMYFRNLLDLRKKLPSTPDLDETTQIALMTFVKEERNKIMDEFVDILKPVSPSLYKIVCKGVDDLTDALVTNLDNDQFKWNNEKTVQQEITKVILYQRNVIIAAIFNYKGKN